MLSTNAQPGPKGDNTLRRSSARSTRRSPTTRAPRTNGATIQPRRHRMFPAICVPGKRGALSRADVKASSARALQFSAQGHATTCVMINRVRGRGGDQRDMPHIPFPAKQWLWSSFPPDVGESAGHGAQPGPDVVQMAAWAWLRDDVTRVYTDTARRSAERFWPRIHALHVPPASDRAPPEAKHVRWSPSPVAIANEAEVGHLPHASESPQSSSCAQPC
jgi:hypothetical protein